MKMHEIKELPLPELEHRLKDLIEEYQNFRFQHTTRQLDNPLRLRYIRRDIARIKTVLHEYKTGRRKPRTTPA
ncbi:MAG: 50S ribosomal protein L29 [candidate division KSB1 bacterium]|nr:50S ribosomal protein L29 [candidate division KSB1 bacterium]MDZ7301370.1 50S ribosomal protein L29 [candidate division KSB1 bacterium]MDZ7310745.1 50S ribosomal protein L29 [candidate division KSB1 bacterium]